MQPYFKSYYKAIVINMMGSPGGSDSKESASTVGDVGSIPGLGRPPGGGHGNSFHYSCLGNPHGQRSLVGYSPWGHKESDMTERLSTQINIMWYRQWNMVQHSKKKELSSHEKT